MGPMTGFNPGEARANLKKHRRSSLDLSNNDLTKEEQNQLNLKNTKANKNAKPPISLAQSTSKIPNTEKEKQEKTEPPTSPKTELTSPKSPRSKEESVGYKHVNRKEVTNCTTCKQQFNIFKLNWKHRFPGCGSIFCKKCLTKAKVLKLYPKKDVKICAECVKLWT